MDGNQKALAAFVGTLITAAATSLLTAVQAVGDGAGIGDLDTAAWLTIVIAVLASTGIVTGTVHQVANKPGDLKVYDSNIPDGDGRYRAELGG